MTEMNSTLAVVLGIRPDVIRASVLLELLHTSPDCELRFIWTGQHYSDNLKDVFFRELKVRPPDIELHAGGETDAEITANVISRLAPLLDTLRPAAAVFLGDTNTVMGCLAAAQLNIPIVHVEGCMRSYDWRMPEEKYRTIIDHLSDVIYAYLEAYKEQGVAEGLDPASIVTVGNPIVDVLERYYFDRKRYFDSLASEAFFAAREVPRGCFYLMTCHRRENVQERDSLGNILLLAEALGDKVYFPASYRTQRALKEERLTLPGNVILTDPIGYEEFLVLLTNSRGVLTDSGTVVEEACVLQIPSIQMRKSTERPEVYDVGCSVKFDPSNPERYPIPTILAKFRPLEGRRWANPLGDGKASQRIARDLLTRLKQGQLDCRRTGRLQPRMKRSFREDGLPEVG